MKNSKKPTYIKYIPNVLSAYRLLAFPVIMIAIFKGYNDLFITLLCVNLITDFFDGFIARKFNCATRIGERLDSLADIGTYISAILGVVFLKWDIMHSHYLFFIFIGAYIIAQLISFIKFKTFPSMHLYSFKLTAVVQGLFILSLFTFGFVHWLFVLALLIGIIACLEEIILLFLIKKMRGDLKGLFWYLSKSI